MGEVCQLPEGLKCCLGQRMVLLRPDPQRAHGRYLLFALQSASIQNQIGVHEGTGSTVSNLRIPALKALNLPCPPLDEQRRIAGVLGALDDKIELNRKMNRTLEEMAQALFKSWFIDFDGFDDLVDSELGPIPKGWEVKSLNEIVELITERVKPTPEKDNEKYVALDDMPSKSIDLSVHRLGSDVNSSITRFCEGDILFGSMRPYFHKVGLSQFAGITRTTTFVLRPRAAEQRHFSLLHLASDAVIEFSTAASVGSTIPYIKWDALGPYLIAVPPGDLLLQFEREVSSLTSKIRCNGRESILLAQLRDTLLPKLISGEIRVPEAEEAVEAAI